MDGRSPDARGALTDEYAARDPRDDGRAVHRAVRGAELPPVVVPGERTPAPPAGTRSPPATAEQPRGPLAVTGGR